MATVKIARNNCAATEITKLVRDHYEPPPATPYKYEKVCQKTSQTLLHETPENSWKDGFNRRTHNMTCGFYSLPNEPYKNMGGKFELDPCGLVLSTMAKSLNTKVWAHRKVRAIPTLMSKQKLRKRRQSLLPSMPVKPTESECLAHQHLKSDGGIDSIKNQLSQLYTAKKNVQWGQSFEVYINDTNESKASKGSETNVMKSVPVSMSAKPYGHDKKSKTNPQKGNNSCPISNVKQTDKVKRASKNSPRRNQKGYKNVGRMRSAPSLVPVESMDCSIEEKDRERMTRVHLEYLEALNVVINTLYNMNTRYLKSKTPLPLDQMKQLRKDTFVANDRMQLLSHGLKPVRDTSEFTIVNDNKTSSLGLINGVASIFSKRKPMFPGKMTPTKKNESVERHKMDDLYLESWEDFLAVDSIQPKPKRKLLSALFFRSNTGATPSSRIKDSECNTPERHRRGLSVKKSPVWTKLAVETNEDKESDEQEHVDQNDIVCDMATKFNDLRNKQQQETDVDIRKLERDRLPTYKRNMSLFDQMNTNFDVHMALLSNVRDNVKQTLDLVEVKMSKWYEELKKRAILICGSSAVDDILYKIGGHATLDHNSFTFGKAKLCLIVMSLPAYEICTVAYQTAIKFVLETILMLNLKNLRQWLVQRNIPYIGYL